MGWLTNKEFTSLDDLLVEQLRDLYDAENRLVDALPKMANAARDPALRQAFERHLLETESQVDRLRQAFALLGVQAERETCQAMKGLLAEGDEMVTAEGDADVKDAALIAAAQRVEHYEIAGYGTARTFARQLGHHEVAQLLQNSLDEESATDHGLTKLAEQSINVHASQV